MLGMEKKVRALYGDDVESKVDNPVVEAKETANSARAGLALAILAIVLAFGVYVALDAKLSSLAQSVADVPAKVAALDAKVAQFEGLPAKIRKQMQADKVAEFAAAADRLAAGLDAAEHKAAMAKISEMAKQLQADVAK
ncbi:hypothetical protein [Solidesulfovibrio sp.]|jgi:hypothetical protein|uniref:hypothetical protein n=1 Tax=Solidesulfovibrio sp. TaxID=2910990 RepID=UPI000EE2612F|nr:hypothetical protein [Solidesulfovibrio sp.]MEA5089640.1 hypothetical protein [Solidesulfovibrio sp.]HCR13884.1 hypothetical protein [Desulfovibrio sp.]HML60857.1 hypothetical protein [Solidesulfovibrio sp.]